MTVIAAPALWPLWIGAALLLFAGVYHQLTDRVPNWISFGTLFAALAVAVMSSLGLVETGGTIFGAVFCVLIGFGILWLPYGCGQIGAGTVKIQAAYCAWIGCATGIPQSAYTTMFATAAVVVLLLLIMYVRRPVTAVDSADFEAPPIEPIPFQLAASTATILGTLLAGGFGFLA